MNKYEGQTMGSHLLVLIEGICEKLYALIKYGIFTEKNGRRISLGEANEHEWTYHNTRLVALSEAVNMD